jgi:hypothetical protein
VRGCALFLKRLAFLHLMCFHLPRYCFIFHRQNEQQIVTAFDVFATLADLATLGSSDPSFEPPRIGAHARTLFAPIERERTCAGARIDAAMCACVAETGQRQAANAVKAEIARRAAV